MPESLCRLFRFSLKFDTIIVPPFSDAFVWYSLAAVDDRNLLSVIFAPFAFGSPSSELNLFARLWYLPFDGLLTIEGVCWTCFCLLYASTSWEHAVASSKAVDLSKKPCLGLFYSTWLPLGSNSLICATLSN